MGGNNSKPQSDHSETRRLSRSINVSPKSSANNIMRRLAIDQSAAVGSLYDARQDCFLKKSPLQILGELQPLKETPQCVIINIDEHQGQSLFNLIDVDKDLYLSVKLNMAPQGELSSLINYPLPTNAHTRILWYHYASQAKYISDEHDILKSNTHETIGNVAATHFVTGIESGVFVVIVLKLSPENESHLNDILKKIAKQLTKNFIKLTESEEQLLDQLTSIKVFSNIPELCESKKLVDVYKSITNIVPNRSKHRLLEYTLQPIRSLVSLESPEEYEYFPLTSETINTIEQHLVQLSLIIKSLKTSIASKIKNSLENLFKDQFNELQQEISNTQKLYKSRIEEIRNMVYRMRRGASQEETIAEMKIDITEKSLQDTVTAVNDRLMILQEKVQLTEDCKKQRIEYWNVKQIVGDDDYDLERITRQLMRKGDRKRIFCFDDKLEKQWSPQWNDFFGKLINERTSNSRLEFVYADFFFCSCQLPQMEVLPSKDNSGTQKQSSKQAPSPSKLAPSPSRVAPSPSKPILPLSKPVPPTSKKMHLDLSNLSNAKFINVLLLGETGVGKSTFINTIVNYLKFESLRQASLVKPIAPIPVSFSMTAGGNSQERIVKFGDPDPNEDHNHPGQSTTQYCRSYVFTTSTQTIRLIDTPGMGDIRGLKQDDSNMQHILSYISNLSHLNAICIFLKPDQARLNVVYRSYFTSLLNFLGANVRNNIIFCFTNTRTTSFAPGDTSPLLKKMLESLPIKDIPYKKSNTFCFDNEAFRYLVGRLNGIEFNDYQKDEYIRSWVASVDESNRFLSHICRALKPYTQENWQSIEHAQFQISQMILPMIETIRNTIRNIVILDKIASKSLIKLHSTPVPRNSGICLGCKRPERVGEFWVMPDILHILSERCDRCQCDLSRHTKVDYALTYTTSVDKVKPSLDEMKKHLDQLKQMIIEFVYFYKNVIRISKQDDPILSVLDQIVEEEMYIRSHTGPTGRNLCLYEDLRDFKIEYEKAWTNTLSNQKPMALTQIYKQIRNLHQNPTISEQLNAIKQTQQMYMYENEKQVSLK